MKKMKRFGMVLLSMAAALLLTAFACAAVEDTGFSDVDSGAWYADAVAYCREHGLMAGITSTTFEPESTLTRSQLAAVLYRAEGEPAVTGTDSFPDTVEGSWYSSAVLWALREGLVSGYDNGLFGTADPVTREQMTAIFWRYAGSPSAGEAGFSDASAAGGYAAAALAWAESSGVIAPVSGNIFAPKEDATRAQVAAALMAFDQLPKGQTEPEQPAPQPDAGEHVLIAYFSNTNQTENIANLLQSILNADLYKITPETPYTSADLNYNNDSCRANQEQNDNSARPAISGSVENMAQYDTVFLGYPIWWGQAPRIISTFLESYDFSGKTIVPFCTSGSSPIGSSAENLHALASGANWLDGQRFSGSASSETVESWVSGLDLPEKQAHNAAAQTKGDASAMMKITINGATLTAALEDNSSADALRELLANSPLTVQMSDYGSMEKVGPLGQSLPRNDRQTDTQAGDIILYQGNQIVIYYDTNSWNFTRLGRIEGTTAQELRGILGSGDIRATFSLEE